MRAREVGTRLLRLVISGVGVVVSLNFTEVIDRVGANWVLTTHTPAPAWLNETTLSPYVQPILLVVIFGGIAWVFWPTGWSLLWPYRQIVKAAEKRKMGHVFLIGMGVLLAASGVYLVWRGATGILTAPGTVGAPASKTVGNDRDQPKIDGPPPENTPPPEPRDPPPSPKRPWVPKLKEFYAEGGGVLRAIGGAETDEQIAAAGNQMLHWGSRTGVWLCENMGGAAMTRFNQINVEKTPSPKFAALNMTMAMLANLQNIIEHDTFDPHGEPIPPPGGCPTS